MNLNGQLQAPPGTTELEAGWVKEKNPWPLPEIEVRFLERSARSAVTTPSTIC